MNQRPERRGRLVAGLVLRVGCVCVIAAAVLNAQQQPTFRATVELIAVDVQVVDNDGAPLDNLRPESFDVTIDGRRHKVVSADFVRHSVSDLSSGNARSSSRTGRDESVADGRRGPHLHDRGGPRAVSKSGSRAASPRPPADSSTSCCRTTASACIHFPPARGSLLPPIARSFAASWTASSGIARGFRASSTDAV